MRMASAPPPVVVIRTEVEIVMKISSMLFAFAIRTDADEIPYITVSSPALADPWVYLSEEAEFAPFYCKSFLDVLSEGEKGIRRDGGLDLRIVDMEATSLAKKLHQEAEQARARAILNLD